MRYALAIIKSAFGPDEARAAVGALLGAKRDAAKLFLFTDHKFDGDKAILVKNIYGDYGTATISLHNAAVAAAASGAFADYAREGLDLLCLERAAAMAQVNCLFLMRHVGALGDADIGWLDQSDGAALREVPAPDGGTNYLVDCRSERMKRAISLATDLYQSGAMLSLSNPSLGRALGLALDVVTKGTRAGVDRIGFAHQGNRPWDEQP